MEILDVLKQYVVILLAGAKLLAEVMWFGVFLFPSWMAVSYNHMEKISKKTMFMVIAVSFAVMVWGDVYLWS